MRRAVARLLAVAAFGPEARRWGGYARSAAAAAANGSSSSDGWSLVVPGTGAVALPAAFVHSHKFPFRALAVTPHANPAAALAATAAYNAAASQAGATTVASRHLVAQQRLLRAAGNDAAAARRLLDAPPSGLDTPQPLLHATRATLSSLDASILAPAALSAVAAARSHAECGKAMRGLQRLVASGPGLGAVLAAPWGEALGRLLGAAPVTEDDQRLWLDLFPLVERLLLGGGWQQVRAL